MRRRSSSTATSLAPHRRNALRAGSTTRASRRAPCEYCLSHAGKTAADIDYVVFYEKPLRKFERLVETYLAFAPSGYKSFSMALPVWLKEKVNLPRVIGQRLAPI